MTSFDYQSDYRTLGAIVTGHKTTFKVWAPEHRSVELIVMGDAPRILPLNRLDAGYWSAALDDVGPGTRYMYRLGGAETQPLPDPASRFQPDGVHGASLVVDPSSYPWTDSGWALPRFDELVFYELHVGTFSPEGTFRGATQRLAALADLGVTAIELMPVGDFAGTRNWGYDGVSLFAPAGCYGAPDDLRAMVDAAHAHGIACFLDVVYNHFGPDGHAKAFSPYYFNVSHHTPWGPAINLDGPSSDAVRQFIVENAVHWIQEYHFDGLRIDATHALVDESPQHILNELRQKVRGRGQRPVYLVAEGFRDLTSIVQLVVEGGLSLDAIWADDFHHHARVHVAGDRGGYCRDCTGLAADLARTITRGWFFNGQFSADLASRRGTDPCGLPPHAFIICLQNHDQIGNRWNGARLNHEVPLDQVRALSALLLLAPQTPLIFMGQEWAASSPFLFFTDHHPALGRLVTEGRRAELAAFSQLDCGGGREQIPDPQAEDTFTRSRLDWTESEELPHKGIRRLYKRLLLERKELRKRWVDASPVFEVNAIDDHTIMLRYDKESLVLIARISGGDGRVPIAINRDCKVTLSTEDPEFTDDRRAIRINLHPRSSVDFERPGAIVLRSA